MSRYINKKQVKEYLNDKEFKMGADLHEVIDEKIEYMLNEACERANQNSRVVVLARDY